jgi:hypothetical protein
MLFRAAAFQNVQPVFVSATRAAIVNSPNDSKYTEYIPTLHATYATHSTISWKARKNCDSTAASANWC